MSPYVPQSARGTLGRIMEGTSPWVALGDFLHGWYRSDARARRRMIRDPLPATDSDDSNRWAALIAASVDWLAWTAEPRAIRAPAWVEGRVCTAETGSWLALERPPIVTIGSPSAAGPGGNLRTDRVWLAPLGSGGCTASLDNRSIWTALWRRTC